MINFTAPVAAYVSPAIPFSAPEAPIEKKEDSFQHIFAPAKEQMQQLANHPAVEKEFEAFLGSLESAYNQGAISHEDMEKIQEALVFATYEHRNQIRETKIDPKPIPYIIHPMQVAHHLLSIGGITDPEILEAALLHDTVEDCATSPDEIEKKFGAKVRKMVEELSDKPGLTSAEQMQYQLEHAPQYMPEAALIKLSDRTCNLRDLLREALAGDLWIPLDRILRYFDHTETFFSIMKQHGVVTNEALLKSLEEIQAARRAAFKPEAPQT